MYECLARYLGSMLVLVAVIGCDSGAARDRQAKIDAATAQVRRIAEDLDSRTTETGVYIRVKDHEMTEVDPWGSPIDVVYSQGGVAETFVVRSAGPDREAHTADDIQAGGMAANLKGLGEGIKKNAEETAANAAKGAVEGTVSGVKESVREAFSRKKKSADTQEAVPVSEPANSAEAQQDAES